MSALREQFDDLEFAVVPNRWKRLWSVAHLAAGSSAEVAYFSSAALRTRIRDRLRAAPFDVAYVTSTSMIPYALDLVPAVPVVSLENLGDLGGRRLTLHGPTLGHGLHVHGADGHAPGSGAY